MKKIHLVCNAHLDPVWLWDWEEGAAEAISTFRIAADFCEKYDGFVFNHNEVVLYQWIEEFAPDLFERIRKLVAQDKAYPKVFEIPTSYLEYVKFRPASQDYPFVSVELRDAVESVATLKKTPEEAQKGFADNLEYNLGKDKIIQK